MEKLSKKKPCKACPWLRSSKTDGSDIQGFSIELMQDLKGTCGDDDGFRNIMACHDSREDKPYGCVGYLAVEGHKNLNVRILAMKGKIPLNEVMENTKELDFYDNFSEMLADYERECDLN
jgi:hypothetical protein